MGQAQINVRTRACSRTSIARTKQAALTHSVRGKRLISSISQQSYSCKTEYVSMLLCYQSMQSTVASAQTIAGH